MQYLERIDAIATRAGAINVTLGELAREAGVQPSTLLRWRTGECDPKLSTVERVLARLETTLERRELAILSQLRTRYCEPAQRPAA